MKVRMDDGSGKLLKPLNLEADTQLAPNIAFKPGDKVRIARLNARADLNGLEGSITGWQESEERWKVKMVDGTGKMLKATNIELIPPTDASGGNPDEGTTLDSPPRGYAPMIEVDAGCDRDFNGGDRVKIVGLQARPNLNGLEATILQWDDSESRWKVRMLDGTGKTFKSENLEVISSARVPLVSTETLPCRSIPAEVFQLDSGVSPGQIVRIVGLTSRSELNDLEGTVDQWDKV